MVKKRKLWETFTTSDVIQGALNFKKAISLPILLHHLGHKPTLLVTSLVQKIQKKTGHLYHRYRLGLSSIQSIHHQLLSPWYFAPTSWPLPVAIFSSRNVCSKLSQGKNWIDFPREPFINSETHRRPKIYFKERHQFERLPLKTASFTLCFLNLKQSLWRNCVLLWKNW